MICSRQGFYIYTTPYGEDAVDYGDVNIRKLGYMLDRLAMSLVPYSILVIQSISVLSYLSFHIS